jgi:hypothetical protein
MVPDTIDLTSYLDRDTVSQYTVKQQHCVEDRDLEDIFNDIYLDDEV